MTNAEFGLAVLTVLLPAAALILYGALTPAAVVAAALATVFAAGWLARKFARRLGGYTGDCLGAVQQLVEAAIYIAILATLGHGALA